MSSYRLLGSSTNLYPYALMVRPSGYWGATSSMRQSGTKSVATSSTPAMMAAMSQGASGFWNSAFTASSLKMRGGGGDPRAGVTTGNSVGVGHRRSRWLDQEPARHLQVERGAELRAVEVEHTGLVGDELEVHDLTRIQACLDVVIGDREAVGGVFGLLHVRNVELHGVALLHADDVRGEVAALRRHPDLDNVAVALDLLAARLNCELALLHREHVGAGRIDVERLQLVGLDDLDIVRLRVSDGRIGNEFHLVRSTALKVDELEVLRVQGPNGEEAVDRPLVERHHVVIVGADRVSFCRPHLTHFF